MKPADDMKKIVKRLQFKAGDQIRKRILDDVLMVYEENKKTKSASAEQNIWRIIMKKRMTKFAIAAVILIAVLGITFLEQLTTTAYAIEQTVEDYQGTRYLYFYYYPCTSGNAGKEAWIQYDENGDVEGLRVNLYNREGQNKHLEEVWREGITLFWRKHENTLEIDENGDYTPVMFDFIKSNDPKQAIENIYKNKEEGRCQIEIEEGSNNNEPIKITARYLPGKYLIQPSNLPAIHDVFVVDPITKLVIRREVYKVLEERIELHGVYKDYDNQPFDPNIFDIEKKIPTDAIRVVHYNVDNVNKVGFDEGSLSPEEADHVVLREFFNALIVKDYNKAGLLFGGMPINEVKLSFGELNVSGLVSVGERVKPGGGSPSYYPCVVEIEENGKIIQWQPKVHIGRVTPHNIKRRRIKAVF